MLCIGHRHELDFTNGDYEDMDKIGAIDLGYGVWMYTRDTEDDDLGKESEKAEYCFCALGCHRVDRSTDEGKTGLMALGIALKMQKKLGGYVYWCDEYEGDTFYLGGMEAFKDRTADWWSWPLEWDWWHAYADDTGVLDWYAIAEGCTARNAIWYRTELERARVCK